MSMRQTIAKILHRAPRAEFDAAGDDARVDSREQGGEHQRAGEGGTTGSSTSESFVGRVAGDDHFAGETGAERRARAQSHRKGE